MSRLAAAEIPPAGLADAIAIGTIVVINALVGFFQEYRAERAVLALRCPWPGVVPGDLLLLDAGDMDVSRGR